MKGFLTKLLLLIGLAGVSSCVAQDNLGKPEAQLGKGVILIPAGWTKRNDGNERINITSPDGQQQVTFSIMNFDISPTFADFKRICSDRLEAEKAQASDISITEDAPFEDAGTFGMFFSGKESSTNRLFSGYVTQKGLEVHTVYLESIGTDSKKHLAVFETFVNGFKRK